MELLKLPECEVAIREQQGFIYNTITILLRSSCLPENIPIKPSQTFCPNARSLRLAPIAHVCDTTVKSRTVLDFSHTRHRYPWLCSLRRRDTEEHLCAVTLLSVPPRRTVVVGAAHCTFLCRDLLGLGSVRPACCCITQGQQGCGEDTSRWPFITINH